MRTIKVFLNTQPVMRRDGSVAHKTSLVARGHGTEMYVSKTCVDREESRKLARAYIAANPHLEDTTTNKSYP